MACVFQPGTAGQVVPAPCILHYAPLSSSTLGTTLQLQSTLPHLTPSCTSTADCRGVSKHPLPRLPRASEPRPTISLLAIAHCCLNHRSHSCTDSTNNPSGNYYADAIGGFSINSASSANTAIQTARRFDGLLSEIRMWSVVRTQEQIVSNMHTQLDGSEASLEMLFNFASDTGADGTTCTDATGSYSGTFTGSNCAVVSMPPPPPLSPPPMAPPTSPPALPPPPPRPALPPSNVPGYLCWSSFSYIRAVGDVVTTSEPRGI